MHTISVLRSILMPYLEIKYHFYKDNDHYSTIIRALITKKQNNCLECMALETQKKYPHLQKFQQF